MSSQPATGRLIMTHPIGVEVSFEFTAANSTDLVEGLDKLISSLVDKGWSVPSSEVPVQQSGSPPLCPIHNKPMKPSQHGGWFCPVKIAEDDGTGKPVYCKATA